MTQAIPDYSISWNEGVFLTNLKTIKGESILECDIYNKRGKKMWFDTSLASCIKKPKDSSYQLFL